jgi:predicted nucleotidyltransferase
VYLSEGELAIVRETLAGTLPGREVWAFGSRVHGRRLKPFSDLDLVVLGAAGLTLDQLARVRAAFRDSALPFRVDVVDWAAADQQFRKIILREHAVLVPPPGGH